MKKINNFLNAPSDSINLGNIKDLKLIDPVKIYWGDEQIGKIIKGKNILSPKVEVLNSEYLDSDKKILVLKKLQDWLDEIILLTLKFLKDDIDQNVTSEIRAIIFNVFENLGTMLNYDYIIPIKKINEHDKLIISKLGIRVGAKFFFMPNLLKKFPMELNALLWRIFYGSDLDNNFPLPTDGRVSFECDIKMPDTYWLAIGYKYLEGFVVRVDVFERIFFIARQKIKYGPFIESSDMMNPIGCNSDQLEIILKFCGFDSLTMNDNKKLFYLKSKNQKNQKNQKNDKNLKKNKNKVVRIMKIKKKKPISLSKNIKPTNKENKVDPNSPFAVLEKLL